MGRKRAMQRQAATAGRTDRSARRSRGLTLIEIMVVVIIIGILVSVIAPNVMGRPDTARREVTRSDLLAIGNALDMYRLDNGAYPSTDQGLDALIAKPSGFPEPRNWGPEPYLKKMPVDQWGNDFVYVSDGGSFELASLAADGEEGGEDEAADLAYADL